MNTQTVMKGVTTITLIVAAVATGALAQNGNQGTVTDEQSIGERVWPPVSNGLIFIDGKYLPPPYTVSRREGDILVNGQQVTAIIRWPPVKIPPPPPPPETEPVMPASITEKTTPHDKDYLAYMTGVRDFLFAKYGQQKGTEMMVDVYLKLPCVRDARRVENEPNTIEFVWADGEKGGVSLVPPRRRDDNLTKEQAQEYIDHFAEMHMNGLDRGDYYMIEGGGYSRTGTTVGAKQTFLPLADAMRATENEADFLAVMKTNQPVGGMSERTFRSFYRHKDEMPAWEARIRSLGPKNE